MQTYKLPLTYKLSLKLSLTYVTAPTGGTPDLEHKPTCLVWGNGRCVGASILSVPRSIMQVMMNQNRDAACLAGPAQSLNTPGLSLLP